MFYQIICEIYKNKYDEKHIIETNVSKFIFDDINKAHDALNSHIDTLCGLGYERTETDNLLTIEREEKGKNVVFFEEYTIKELIKI